MKGDGHSWASEGVWSDDSTIGSFATAQTGDYKNGLWSQPAQDIMYKIGVDGDYGVFEGCLAGTTLPTIFSTPWASESEALYCTATADVTATSCEDALAFKSYNLGDEQGKAMLSCRTNNSNNADNGIGMTWHNQFCSGQDFGCNPYAPDLNFQAYSAVTLWLR